MSIRSTWGSDLFYSTEYIDHKLVYKSHSHSRPYFSAVTGPFSHLMSKLLEHNRCLVNVDRITPVDLIFGFSILKLGSIQV